MRISEVATVRRYQDAREQTEDVERINGRGYVWHEVRPDDLDPLTGFVMPEKLVKVRLYRKPGEFALQKGDIVMVFQGAPSKIGVCGLVVDSLFAVPSRVLCIIRAKDFDPLGLFFWLSDKNIMQEMAALAKLNPKNGKAFLSLDSIRCFQTRGEPENLAQAAEKGRELLDTYWKSRASMAYKLEEIGRIFAPPLEF